MALLTATALKMKSYFRDRIQTKKTDQGKEQIPKATFDLMLPAHEPAVPDISLVTIQLDGLPALLNSKLPLLYFLLHLLHGRHVENLWFIMELHYLRDQNLRGRERVEKYGALYGNYFTESSSLILNVSKETITKTKELLRLNDPLPFQHAYHDVAAMLQKSLHQFAASDTWKFMFQDLGLTSETRTISDARMVTFRFEELIKNQIIAGKSPCYTGKARKIFWQQMGQVYKSL